MAVSTAGDLPGALAVAPLCWAAHVLASALPSWAEPLPWRWEISAACEKTDSNSLPFKQKPTNYVQLFLSHWKFTAQCNWNKSLNNPILLGEPEGDRKAGSCPRWLTVLVQPMCLLRHQTAGAKSRATDREQHLRNTPLLPVKSSTCPSISSGEIN